MDIDLERYRENQRYLAFLSSGFLASQLLRVLHAFNGDLLGAVVLGEIAQHNVQALFRDRQFRPGERLEQALADPRQRERLLRPCNAHSVSEATGIPRETVRRRIENLVTQGWIIRDRHERLAHFHLETARSVVETADTVRQVLGVDSADVRLPSRTRADVS
jgi:hypothetical protein